MTLDGGGFYGADGEPGARGRSVLVKVRRDEAARCRAISCNETFRNGLPIPEINGQVREG
jgi:hypothetical protein